MEKQKKSCPLKKRKDYKVEYSKQLNSAKETPIPSPNVAHSAPPSPSPWCHAKRLASLRLHILTLWWTKCTSL